VKFLVVTVVHRPGDARVYSRQIRALLEAGHEVTLAAPWSATGAEPLPGVDAVDLPRAVGRDRRRAQLAAKDVMWRRSADHDLVLIHNPELVPVAGAASVPVVFDVHEDLGAALVDKGWLPPGAAAAMRPAIRALERRAEKRFHLILAEASYQSRFRLPHPVVPNEPVVPDHVEAPGGKRVVHLGRHSVGRGLSDLVQVAELAPSLDFELLGWADQEVAGTLEDVSSDSNVYWSGEIENETALTRLDGAMAGLSLLHDLPNYRHSRPTKIVEYMSRGVPVITTPLPVAVDMVEAHGSGLVVPFRSPEAVLESLETLRANEELRRDMGARGHLAALEHFNWRRSGPDFVRLLEGWARS
jgi:glycosyltransferase involved in cell wall biosynthesis